VSETTLSAEVEAALLVGHPCPCPNPCPCEALERWVDADRILRTALERSARIEAAAQELEASQESVNGANDETYRRLSAAKNALRAALNDREDG
jgi:hypothetical protein